MASALNLPLFLRRTAGSPLAYATGRLNGVTPYHFFDFTTNRVIEARRSKGAIENFTGYTFTRASGGYYQNADGTLTWNALNALAWSEDYTQSSWTRTNVNVTGATTIAAIAGAGQHRVSRVTGITVPLTVSAEVSPGTHSTFTIYDGSSVNNFAIFNLAGAGSILAQGSNTTATITAVSTSRYKVVVTYGATNLPNGNTFFGLGSTSNLGWGSDSYTALGTETLTLHYTQVEVGTQASAYVRTTSAANGAMRRGDRGVLIEGARTNLWSYSQDFSVVGSWPASNLTIGEPIAAPDGTITAQKIQVVSGAAITSFYRQYVATATTFTWSVYFKQGNNTTLRFLLQNNTTAANLIDGSFVFATKTWTGPAGVLFEELADGWFRMAMPVSTGVTVGNTLRLWFNFTGSIYTEGLYFYLWGAQFEDAAFPSSYIPTTTASATRAADVLTCSVNTSEILAAAVANQPELVTNGGFDSDTAWTKGTGWTIGAGVAAIAVPGTNSNLLQSISAEENASYLVTITATRASGQVACFIGADGNGGALTVLASGTFSQIIRRGTGALNFYMQASSSFEGTIDSVSVKKIPADTGATIYPLSLYAEFERLADTGTIDGIISLDASSTSNELLLYTSVAKFFRGFVANAGATQADVPAGDTVSPDTLYKGAARFNTNSCMPVRDGTLGTEDASVTLPILPLTHLRIGGRAGATSLLFGYIRRAAVFNSALSDADLQRITT